MKTTTEKLSAATCLALALQTSPALAQTRTAANAPEVVPTRALERKTSLEPKALEAKPEERITFHADPIADPAIIVVSLGSAGVLELINSTGEIRPQQIEPGFNRNNLIWIDRGAVTDTPHPSAGPLSNMGLGVMAAFAVLDPFMSGMREHSVQTGLVDAIMYAESASITLALTNVVKMAVRRPRPIAYLEADAHSYDPNYSNTSTDSALSFFSGHSSMTGALGATATYLAFARSPGTLRPWLTLILTTGVCGFVSVQRVRAGKHFPTDVIAGSFAGAGIGVVVPHLHRSEELKQRPVWVGFVPADSEQAGAQGGALTLNGVF